MKTTIDISDALYREVRQLARDSGATFRALVERGLGQVLAEARQPPPGVEFSLRVHAEPGVGGLLAPYDRLGLAQAIADTHRENPLDPDLGWAVHDRA